MQSIKVRKFFRSLFSLWKKFIHLIYWNMRMLQCCGRTSFLDDIQKGFNHPNSKYGLLLAVTDAEQTVLCFFSSFKNNVINDYFVVSWQKKEK